jgi:phospholipase/carboxylesterase
MVRELDPDAVLWSAPVAERDGRPLLVAMHGRGSDERDLFALAPALPSGYVVASVRAPIAEGPGWSWWDPGGRHGDPDAEDVDLSAAAVLTWLDALPFAAPATGTLGFSQGGAMATHLLRRDPARFSFAVNLAGFAIGGAQKGDAALAISRPPVFWGRGGADELFTPEIVARTEPWLAACTTAETRVYPGLGHSISQQELDDVVGFLSAVE